MDPVYLGHVFSKIFIVHLLPRLIQNHIAGSDNDVPSVNIEMRLAGGNIQQLPVNSAVSPPGGKLVMTA